MAEYFYPKHNFERCDVDGMYVFFRNGDYFKVERNEIVDINLKLYDNLMWNGRQTSPIVESGFIKLKIREGNKSTAFLHNTKEYLKDRKTYVEERMRKESCSHVCIFNEYSWHNCLFGDAHAELAEDCLIINYKPNALYGPCESENHVISLNNISTKAIEKICLDFENCDYFEIFNNEIVDMQLTFENELVWNSHGYARKIKSGFIRIKFEPEITWRKIGVWCCDSHNPKKQIKGLIKRLCYKDGECETDICNLYVDYDYMGYGVTREERIDVDDIRPSQYFEANEDEDSYVSGYAMKQSDGTVLIRFGKKN